MKNLIVPGRLKSGDTVAFISLSGGRAGDEDMLSRYHTGKRRFAKAFGVNVIETPNALRGSRFLYEHPEKRAEDLMWALKNETVQGIICNQGGDDSYRVLPFIDTQVIHDHPKVFMGFSDIATWMAVFAYSGVRAYYGPTVLTPIAQPGRMDEYTEDAIRRTLFSNETIGEIKPSERHTPIDWNKTYEVKRGSRKIKYERFPETEDPDAPEEKINWTVNTGYKVLQGSGSATGYLVPVCGGPLRQIMGTKFFYSSDIWEDAVIAMEHCNVYGSKLAGLHELRAFAAAGAFDKAKAIVTGPLDCDSEETLLQVINKEAGRSDMLIMENVDFIHRTPMTVLPVGAKTEVDCDKPAIRIMEPGVS